MREMTARYLDEPAGTLRDRLLRQAGRELMLAQSSDWPFIITNGTTEEYARRRFHDHLNRFHELLFDLERDQIDPEKLGALEYMDALFLELDSRQQEGNQNADDGDHHQQLNQGEGTSDSHGETSAKPTQVDLDEPQPQD